MANPDIKKRLVNQVFEQIEKQYALLQKSEAAELHNAFARIIRELKPTSESLLLVIEILKQEVIGNLIARFQEVKEASAQMNQVPQEKPQEETSEE